MDLPFPISGYRPGRYAFCQWCHGRGCACCDGEALAESERKQAEYEKQFPNGLCD